MTTASTPVAQFFGVLPPKPVAAAGAIDFRGELASAPTNKLVANSTVYRDTTKDTTFIWDGTKWVALVEDGKTGPQGQQGAQGPAGATGATGATGAPGTNGTNGTNGVNAEMTETSTTSLAIATGSTVFVFAVASVNLGWALGTRIRAASNSNGANFMEGVVTALSTTQVTILVDFTGGSGTHADWNLFISGSVGATGATGATGPAGSNGTNGTNGINSQVTATSTTSFAIGTGSTTFVYTSTAANLGWLIGTRLRAASNAGPTNFMEGLVTAVSNTQVTILVDAIGGSGTHADWNIFISGSVGATGATGATGPTGPAGSSDYLGQQVFT